MKRSFIYLFFLVGPLLAESPFVAKLGAGYGNGFGMFGGGVEFEFYNVAIAGGVGSYLTSEITYDASLRYYFGHNKKLIRPFASMAYGPMDVHPYTINHIETTDSDDEEVNIVVYGMLFMGGVDLMHPSFESWSLNLSAGIARAVFGLPKKAQDTYDIQNEQVPELPDKFRVAFGLRYLLRL